MKEIKYYKEFKYKRREGKPTVENYIDLINIIEQTEEKKIEDLFFVTADVYGGINYYSLREENKNEKMLRKINENRLKNNLEIEFPIKELNDYEQELYDYDFNYNFKNINIKRDMNLKEIKNNFINLKNFLNEEQFLRFDEKTLEIIKLEEAWGYGGPVA